MVISLSTYAPPEQLSSLRTSSSLTLQWIAPPFEQTNGAIQYYEIEVTELDTGMMFTTTSTGIVIQIPNLHPHYTYVSRVAAFTVGIGPYSDPITVQLDPAGKIIIESLNCTFIYNYVLILLFVDHHPQPQLPHQWMCWDHQFHLRLCILSGVTLHLGIVMDWSIATLLMSLSCLLELSPLTLSWWPLSLCYPSIHSTSTRSE